jgi:hypothetical protein
MAVKYECDRCKKLQNQPLHPLSPRGIDYEDDFSDWRLNQMSCRYDLCESCLVLIAEILSNPKAIVTVPSIVKTGNDYDI